MQVRDWLYVDDHVDALLLLKKKKVVFESYNIGGNCEKTNLELVDLIFSIMKNYFPKHFKSKNTEKLSHVIDYVPDRPGHDIRYAIDTSKIHSKFGWKPLTTIETGLKNTISNYLNDSRSDY